VRIPSLMAVSMAKNIATVPPVPLLLLASLELTKLVKKFKFGLGGAYRACRGKSDNARRACESVLSLGRISLLREGWVLD